MFPPCSRNVGHANVGSADEMKSVGDLSGAHTGTGSQISKILTSFPVRGSAASFVTIKGNGIAP